MGVYFVAHAAECGEPLFFRAPHRSRIENRWVGGEIDEDTLKVGVRLLRLCHNHVMRAREELAAVSLADRAAHYPAQLSGGEQQRVALARAIAGNPAILVADEPTGNLDDATGNAIIDLIFELKRARGTTLVLVTHDAALAARCDRVVRMRSGRIEPAGSDVILSAAQ